MAYGEEGASNPNHELYVINNTFLNDDVARGTFVLVGAGVSKPILMQNNIFSGTGALSNQVSAVAVTNYRSVAPGFVDRCGYDLRPTANPMVIDAGSAPGYTAHRHAADRAGAIQACRARHGASGVGPDRYRRLRVDLERPVTGLPNEQCRLQSCRRHFLWARGASGCAAIPIALCFLEGDRAHLAAQRVRPPRSACGKCRPKIHA
ncbi:hypothetical protein LP419_33970 [Massilia sp. H-1]|nr:hypothetical protein LP419_33970 [Massilia sp. H-1]